MKHLAWHIPVVHPKQCTESLRVLVTWSGHQPPIRYTELQCDYFGDHDMHAGFLEGMCISWSKG